MRRTFGRCEAKNPDHQIHSLLLSHIRSMAKLWRWRPQQCFLLILVGAHGFIHNTAQQRPSLFLPIAAPTQQLVALHSGKRGQNEEDDPSSKQQSSNSILSRFTNPRIDDPGLPLTDGLVLQVIAPSVQIAVRLVLGIPPPTWLQSTDPSLLYNNRPGGLLAPTLLHGAALALVWLIGALAARAYERPAISPVKQRGPASSVFGKDEDPAGTSTTSSSRDRWDYSRVWLALFQAGAAATGLWIFATQVEVYMDVGGYAQWGDSTATDGRLIIAATEGIADFVFEAITIIIWRLYLAYQTERMGSP
jgi:hypothetical protein